MTSAEQLHALSPLRLHRVRHVLAELLEHLQHLNAHVRDVWVECYPAICREETSPRLLGLTALSLALRRVPPLSEKPGILPVNCVRPHRHYRVAGLNRGVGVAPAPGVSIQELCPREPDARGLDSQVGHRVRGRQNRCRDSHTRTDKGMEEHPQALLIALNSFPFYGCVKRV